jgi:hypothetical protein
LTRILNLAPNRKKSSSEVFVKNRHLISKNLNIASNYQESMTFIVLDLLEAFYSQAIGIIFGVVIGVVTLVLFEVLLRYWKKPKITITTSRKEKKLGFSVSVDKQMIKDARVRCNGKSYSWEDETEEKRRDLYVGDDPSSFYPYRINSEYLDDASNYTRVAPLEKTISISGWVLITVKEIASQETVFQCAYPIPQLPVLTSVEIYARHHPLPRFNVAIRIIGEGVEEKRDYSLILGLKDLNIPVKEGKPLMEYVSVNFELEKESFFFRHKDRFPFFF